MGSYLGICSDYDVAWYDCKYAPYRSWYFVSESSDKQYSDATFYESLAVPAAAYAMCFGYMMLVSFIGFFFIFCKSDHCAKIYAFLLVAGWVWLTIMDYWTIDAEVNYWNQNNKVFVSRTRQRNFYGFQAATAWFVETI